MKKIVIIFLFLFFPQLVFAESVWLECPSKVNKNEEFTCDVKGYSSYEICALEYQFYLPSSIKKIAFTVDPIWQGGEYENKVVLYTEKNKVGDFNLGKLTLKSSKGFNEKDIKTTWLLFGDKDLKDHILIDEKDDVNELKSNKKNQKIFILLGALCVMIGIIGVTLKNKKKKVGK